MTKKILFWIVGMILLISIVTAYDNEDIWYTFDHDGVDNVGNQNIAQLSNVTFDTSTYKIGTGSMKLSNLSNSFANLSINLSNNHSISFWYLQTTKQSGGDDVIIGADNNSRLYRVSVDTGKTEWRLQDFSHLWSMTPDDGNWHHVVISRCDNNVYLYGDGSLKASGTESNSYSDNVPLTIGNLNPSAIDDFSWGRNNSIDDMRIWQSYCLANQDVSLLYNGGSGSNKSLSYLQNNIPALQQLFTIGDCTGATNESLMSFYVSDEETKNNITETLSLQGTIEGSYNGSKKNFSFGFNQAPHFDLCYAPNNNGTIRIDGLITYKDIDNASLGDYVTRHYYFINDSLTGTDNTYTLYTINRSISDQAFFDILDENDDPIVGAYVKALRYYPSTNTYEVVNIEQVPDNGRVLHPLIPFEAFYKFIIQDGTTIIRQTKKSPILTSPLIIRIPLKPNPFDLFNNVNDVQSNFVYNNITRKAIFTYVDNNNVGDTYCLRTYSQDSYSRTILNTTCLTGSTGSIEHSLPSGNLTKTYTFQAYINKPGNTEFPLLTKIVTFSNAFKDIFGNDGLFYNFILVSVLSAVGFFSPPAAIMLSLLALVASNIMGMIYIEASALISVIIVGIIFFVRSK